MEDCPICLEPFTGGSVVIVCQTPHHRTCNDCFHNLYGLSPSNPMSGKCPECRAPLLKLDSDHPYPETLPMVTLDRINNPPPPVHNPPPVEEEPPRQRRRTIAQFTADIDAVEDDGERGFLAAKREYHRLRNGPGGHACLTTRLKKRLGADHPEYLAAYRATVQWRRENPAPKRSNFR